MTGMQSSYFVAGTDTGIGKTLVAAALIHALKAQGRRVAGMKPVAAGAFRSGDAWHNDDVDALTAASGLDLDPGLVCPYLLHDATAPHLAAAAQRVQIGIPHLRDCYQALARQADQVIVEGAGGFMVPLDQHHGMDDLACALGLPVILVVGMRLGCISHALLTVEAILARGLVLAGWVANVIEAEMLNLAATTEALQQRIGAPMLGFLPRLPVATAAGAAALLDVSLLAAAAQADPAVAPVQG